MHAIFRRKRTWLLLFVLALVGAFLWSVAMQVRDVVAVQESLDRAWEISFEDPLKDTRPSLLPESIDSAVDDWLERKFAHTHGYGGSHDPKTRNRAPIHHERFRAIFRGPLENIHIYYPEKFSPDLGKALVRIPTLRAFSLEESDSPGPSEADWTQLCGKLRSCRNLETISLAGDQLTDAAIAPLSGHPRLKSITVLQGRLTMACAKTLATLANLRDFHIEGQVYEGETWLTPEQDQAMRRALPGVNVSIP